MATPLQIGCDFDTISQRNADQTAPLALDCRELVEDGKANAFRHHGECQLDKMNEDLRLARFSGAAVGFLDHRSVGCGRATRNERFAPQLPRGDFRLRRQRVVVAHDAEQVAVRNDGGFDRRIVGLGNRRDAGTLAEEQVVADIFLGEVIAVEDPQWAALLDALHSLGNELQANAGRCAEAENRRAAARYRADRFGKTVELAEDPIHLSEDECRFCGRHESAGNTLKERGADFVLETPDRHAEAWLRDIQLARRSAQRAGGHDGPEDFDLSFLELSGHQQCYSRLAASIMPSYRCRKLSYWTWARSIPHHPANKNKFR